jgi:hypothetical protein
MSESDKIFPTPATLSRRVLLVVTLKPPSSSYMLVAVFFRLFMLQLYFSLVCRLTNTF